MFAFYKTITGLLLLLKAILFCLTTRSMELYLFSRFRFENLYLKLMNSFTFSKVLFSFFSALGISRILGKDPLKAFPVSSYSILDDSLDLFLLFRPSYGLNCSSPKNPGGNFSMFRFKVAPFLLV